MSPAHEYDRDGFLTEFFPEEGDRRKSDRHPHDYGRQMHRDLRNRQVAGTYVRSSG